MGDTRCTTRGQSKRQPRRSLPTGARAAAALFVLALIAGLAPQARAADLEIISKISWESAGRKLIQPCVKNNTAERRDAVFRLGVHSVYWTFAPLPVDAGKVTCFTLDSPVIIKGVDNDVELE